MIFHNSWSDYYRKPFGAIATDEFVDIWLSMPGDAYVQNTRLFVCNIDEWEQGKEYPMKWIGKVNGENRYHVKVSFDTSITKFYYFKLNVNGRNMTVKRNWDNKGIMSLDEPHERYGVHWQLTVYDKDMETPEELKGIMYQIYADRFARSYEPKKNVSKEKVLREDWGAIPEYRPNEDNIITNSDFFQGDLKGIQNKLSYLKSLEVTVIYLNPIFEAYSNHGYDTGDYMKIEPLKGTNEDFKQLCEEAKKYGISIILDGVFSHTGSDSKYFNKYGRYDSLGAYQSKDSPYYDWYKFEEFPNKYRCWWDFDTLPEIDKDNEEYISFIKSVIRYWMNQGANGFRLDVADELTNKILDAIAKTVKEFGNKPVIGEVWEDASTKIAYGGRRKYFTGRQLDSVMNYPFKEAILNYIKYGNPETLYYPVMSISENYPKPVLNGVMNLLGSHDTVRAITKLVGIEGNSDRVWQINHHYLSDEQYSLGKKRLKLASVMQYFFPGIPSLYYGDEAGLMGYKDPFNRCCYPWGKEDKELLEHFRSLGKVRMDRIKYLWEAEFKITLVTENICIFQRKISDKVFIVALNRTADLQKLQIPEEYKDARIIFNLENSNTSTLSPYGAIILES